MKDNTVADVRGVGAALRSWCARIGLGIAKEWLFACLLTSFCLIYIQWYPATISSQDESAILSTVYSFEHASLFILDPRPQLGVLVGNHIISRFSPFHA